MYLFKQTESSKVIIDFKMESCNLIDVIHNTDSCDCKERAQKLERAIRLLDEAYNDRIEA